MGVIRKLPSASEMLKAEEDRFEVFSTGFLMLDLAIGQQDPKTGKMGIPCRAICEVFGTHMTGKTMLAEQLVKNILATDPTYKVVYILTEEPNLKRMRSIGLDTDRVLVWSYVQNPEDLKKSPEGFMTAETGLDLSLDYVRRDPTIKAVIIDTVKALVFDDQTGTSKEVISMGDSAQPAVLARMMDRYIKDWLSFNNSNAILLMLNQISERIGADYTIGADFKFPTVGGRTKEQQSTLRIKADSVRIESEADNPLSQTKDIVGLELFYTIYKNKYCSGTLRRRAVTEVLLDPFEIKVIDKILALGVHCDIIQLGGGGWYTFPSGEKCQGKDNAVELLKANPDLVKQIEAEIMKNPTKIYGQGTKGSKSLRKKSASEALTTGAKNEAK